MTKDEIFELCDDHIEQITTGIISLSELVWNQAWNEAIEAAAEKAEWSGVVKEMVDEIRKLKR